MLIKKSLLFLLLVAGTYFLKGQGFYISPTLGYSHAIGGQDYEYIYIKKGTEQYMATSESIGFNTGMRGQVSLGYIFKNRWGVDLEIGYQSGEKELSYYTFLYLESNGWPSQETLQESYRWNSSAFSLKPSLRIETGEKTKCFLKAGLLLNRIKLSESYKGDVEGSQYLETLEIETVYDPKWSLGGFAEIGLDIPMNERIYFTTSISCEALSFYPDRAQLTSYKENGREMINTLFTNEKEIEYVKEYDAVGTASDRVFPRESTRVKMAFSAVAIHLGVRYFL